MPCAKTNSIHTQARRRGSSLAVRKPGSRTRPQAGLQSAQGRPAGLALNAGLLVLEQAQLAGQLERAHPGQIRKFRDGSRRKCGGKDLPGARSRTDPVLVQQGSRAGIRCVIRMDKNDQSALIRVSVFVQSGGERRIHFSIIHEQPSSFTRRRAGASRQSIQSPISNQTHRPAGLESSWTRAAGP